MTRLFSLILFAVCSLPAFTQTTRLVHVFSGANGTGGASVTLDASGRVYGTGQTIHASDVFFQLTPPADGTTTWTAVAPAFGTSVGACPCSELIHGADGNFYGTASHGGFYGMGTVFMVTPGTRANGKALHSFNGANGSTPSGGLTFDAQGNIYGTTSWGGTNNAGTVFELIRAGNWNERVVHNFNLDGIDGAYPTGRVVFDASGNMYGSTGSGGPTTPCGQYICSYGTVFEIDQKGVESVLYAFTTNTNGPQDAQFPTGDLAMDAHGNLYGTSETGGTIECAEGPAGSNIVGGCGTVFEISPGPNGWTEQVIHEFNGVKGAFPFGSVVIDAQGNLYGATSEGGTSYGKVWPDWGVVYKLYPSGTGGWIEKVLHNFTFNGHDGYTPSGNVALDGAGHLFGSTAGGGTSTKCGTENGMPHGCGTVFQVTLP